MDFNSLMNGTPFYVLRKGEKPILEVGVVKGKSQPRAQYPTQTPNIGVGLQLQQVIESAWRCCKRWMPCCKVQRRPLSKFHSTSQ